MISARQELQPDKCKFSRENRCFLDKMLFWSTWELIDIPSSKRRLVHSLKVIQTYPTQTKQRTKRKQENWNLSWNMVYFPFFSLEQDPKPSAQNHAQPGKTKTKKNTSNKGMNFFVKSSSLYLNYNVILS